MTGGDREISAADEAALVAAVKSVSLEDGGNAPTTTKATEPATPASGEGSRQSHGTGGGHGSVHKVHHGSTHLPRVLLRNKSLKRAKEAAEASPSPATAGGHEGAQTAAAAVPGGEIAQGPIPAQPGAPGGVRFMEQVLDWVKHERQRQRDWIARREGKKSKKAAKAAADGASASAPLSPAPVGTDGVDNETGGVPLDGSSIERAGSPASVSTTDTIHLGASTDSLDHLERLVQATILEASSTPSLHTTTGTPTHHHPSSRAPIPHKRSLRKLTRRPSTSYASDTDANAEGDVIVPECEVELRTPEAIGWDDFKSEVLKLTHTLRCKGWRRIALDRFKELEIKRISGALTNAVFLVVPPPVGQGYLAVTPGVGEGAETPITPQSTRTPSKLLLRIYGEQVLHLIDRPSELSILRRLARKKIGPRLLGTFYNGRFEQYLESTTLTKDDIRDPLTSRMIAKRMKELHCGIEVLPEERAQGPTIWKNWEKWLPRVRGVMGVVDKTRKMNGEASSALVCGAEWAVFEKAVERYRQWLVGRYEKGIETLNQEMVFAHNDTQYGNILRMVPTTTDSPLLLPSNTHRQLVVIDFEYSSPNPPGFEFANHFCEWMADYHGEFPHKIQERYHPNPTEQRNFLLAYVQHQPRTLPQPLREQQSQSQQPFSLDSPSATDQNKKELEEVEKLVRETEAWRPASHAMWAAWGIVQAKSEEEKEEEKEKGADSVVEEGFDYLGYARERVLLFWGDLIMLGVLTEKEVEELLGGWKGWRRVGSDW